MTKSEQSTDFIYLAILIAASLALRLDYLAASHFVVDSDEAIVGLMAKHILEGHKIPTFYYGQHYMGSLEAILTSVVFLVAGISSVSLKIVPLLFSLALIPLVYAITNSLWDKNAAKVSALLVALPPASLLEWGTKTRGGFIEILILGGIALLFTIRWLKSDLISIRPIAFIGFILGLGWWTNNQIIFFALPIGLFILLRLIRTEKPIRIIPAFIYGSISFLIGSLPFWIYNIRHDWVSFEMLQSVEDKDLTKHFSGLFEVSLPILVGAKRFWGDADVIPGTTFIASILFSLLLAAYIWGRKEEIGRFILGKIDSTSPTFILFIFIITCGAVFALSSFGYLVEAPRYLLPIYVGLFPLIGISSSFLPKILRPIVIGGILSLHLLSSYYGGRAIPGEPFVYGSSRVARDHTELIKWLKKEKIKLVRTNYWIGYRLAFETNEEVKFLMFSAPYRPRIQDYENLVVKDKKFKIPILIVHEQLFPVIGGLDALGFKYRVKMLKRYAIIFAITPKEKRLKPTQSRISPVSSVNDQSSSLMIDGNIESRWGSGMPQSPDMKVKFKFEPPLLLRGIKYSLGKFVTDYPRDLVVYGITPEGDKKEILSSPHYKLARSLIEGESEMTVYSAPHKYSSIEFEQHGKDPFFDWSIAEVNFYE